MTKWTDTPPTVDALAPEVPVEAPAEKKTIEQWGEQKGMWPQKAMPGSPAARDYWKFAQAQTWCKWTDGQELTEAEFDKGVADALAPVTR